MLNTLPPGVTGTEDAFGPKAESDVQIEASCYHCPWEGEVTAERVLWTSGAVDYFECPQCGTENDIEVVEDDGMEASDADYGESR